MKFIRPVVTTVGSVNEAIRDANRFRHVAVILAKAGFGFLFSGLSIPGVQTDTEMVSNPKRVLEAIQKLGPTFIKFGQILSTRPDIIPSAYIEEFSNLQDKVVSLPFADIECILTEDLGENWRNHFSSFEETPLASASIAQVHKAILHDGSIVVLKIQRPNIDTQIRSDLNILQFIMERALIEFPEFALFDPIGMFMEFKRSLMQELDFRKEQKNLIRFTKNFADIPIVRVPKTYPNLNSTRILCMEFFDAIGIRYAREKGFDMKKVGENYLHVAYSMLFEHGFFHGDLHPGNILVFPDGTLGLLDCGMVGFLSEEMKNNLAGLIFSLYRGDHRMVAKIFYDLSIKEERVDFNQFEQDAIDVSEQHWTGESFLDMDIGAFLMDISARAMRHKVRAPPAYTMFFKGVMTTEGLAKSLLPEVDPLRAAQPFVEELIYNRWEPQKLTEIGTYNLLSFSSLLRRLPISLGQLLDDFDHQRFSVLIERSHNLKERKFHHQTNILYAVLAISFLWTIVGIGLFFVPLSFIFEIPIPSILLLIFSGMVQCAVLFGFFLQNRDLR